MVKVEPDKLRKFVADIFTRKGLSPDDASVMAGSLVDSNLSGRASHGVLRAANYLTRLGTGGAKANPNIRIVHETDTSALLDGDNGLGMIVSYKAAQLTREKARKSGMACVTAKNSNHYGAAAYWAEMIGRDDMIAFSCCNVEPLMAPPGAKDVALGTNPLCVYVPAGKRLPICLDLATSVVAQGKLFDYRLKHLPLPDGWALDASGMPTNDAEAAKLLTPFAGHKGYGFAVIVEVMSSLLSGGQFGKAINGMYADIDKPNNISHCFMAIRIDCFRDPDSFKADVDSFIDFLHQTPVAEGQRIYLPGEIESLNKEKNLAQGLELPEDLVAQLMEIGESLGVGNVRQYFENQD